MSVIKKIYLIGLGAIGGAYADRIQENCPGCMKVVVDRERAGRYGRSGITINGTSAAFDFVIPDEIQETADLIIIAVKQHHLFQAMEDIRKLVRPDTIILSLLNGISSEEVLGQEFGIDKMLYSFVVGTDAVRTGTDIRYTNLGRIVFGDRTNSKTSQKVAVVQEFFDRAHIPYNVPEDMMRELWWKFMMNVGVNQVSAVLRAPYGVFARGHARYLMFAASREVLLLSRKAGINLSNEDMEEYGRILDSLAPQGKTSMLQDVEAGRKTEVEIFAGTVTELGRKYGVETPVNDMLYKIIKSIEQMAGIKD